MRADADFMVYVAARWPSLVKEAVLLGCPPEQAAEAATDALSRCRRAWGRASREEDVDQLVRREVGAAVARRPRTEEGTRERAAQELLVLAPPTLDDFARQEGVNRRRVLRRAGVIAAPLLLVAAGAGAYVVTDGDEPPNGNRQEELEQAAITREENPAPGVVWYADDRLHLEHVVLAVEGIRQMTAVGTGVVYGDDEGRVVYAADDGSREVLGRTGEDGRIAAADENGWAAWVDPGGDRPAIVVKEAATGNAVGRFPVDDDAKVVAVDGNAVYVTDESGAHALLPDGSAESPVTPALLLDVRSRIRVFQLDDDTIQVVQSMFSIRFELPGRGAVLSPDGNTVATRLPGSDNQIAVYDTRSGDELVDGLSSDDATLAFAPGDRGTISYIVAPHGLTPGRELELRTCDLASALCRIAARIPNTGGSPVLAR